MPYEELPTLPVKNHALSIEGRAKMRISGVEDVSGFDEGFVLPASGSIDYEAQRGS